ncbi:MAG: hypothetical protein ACXVGN_05700 [Mycobacteriaceae bacterium]|jgi:hypothetical protein
MWNSLFGRDPDRAPAPESSTPPPPAEPFADRMLARMLETSWTARRAGARLPVAALPHLGLIEDLAIPLLQHLRTSPPSVDEEIAVEGIVTDYLPTTINAYLSMNHQFAHQVRPDGRTPGDDLLDQLQTLEHAIADLTQAVYAHDAQQLAVQGRFLSTKFDRSDLDL